MNSGTEENHDIHTRSCERSSHTRRPEVGLLQRILPN